MSTPVLKLFDLTGKTALVTGGSRGLGLQIAEALGEAGARVLLTSRKADDLEESAAQLQGKGIDARWIAADLQPAERDRARRRRMRWSASARSTSSSTTPARPGARRPRTIRSRPGTR